jgi:hypothetical protein
MIKDNGKIFKVYKLQDPITRECRYIGVTVRTLKRVLQN